MALGQSPADVCDLSQIHSHIETPTRPITLEFAGRFLSSNLTRIKPPPRTRALQCRGHIFKVALMDFFRDQLRMLARLAVLVIGLVALLPTLGILLSSKQSASEPWMPICSTQSTDIASSAIGSSDRTPGESDQKYNGQGSHCPFCLQQSTTAVMPSPETYLPVRTDLAMAVPELFLQAPKPLFVWGSAQARAPPAQG